MHRKAAHSKAAGDVLLLKHRVRRNPQPQALGQYLRLFDPGLRHQNDEFVSAVASDHIRLPALLFQQPPDASQH